VCRASAASADVGVDMVMGGRGEFVAISRQFLRNKMYRFFFKKKYDPIMYFCVFSGAWAR
jgi:hypothetical protein